MQEKAAGRSKALFLAFVMAGVLGYVALLEGCSAGYLLHVGKGQLRIVCGCRSVEEVLRDPKVAGTEKEKIRLVLEAKAFGEKELGLTASKNYTVYYSVERPPVAHNLTASPRFDLEAYEWCFPIAGCLPYKGFFTRDRAAREADRMSKRGYDTYLRPVAAYSTLGWFKDPIFSTMLQYGDADLVELILHEMVHRTIFVKDQGSFNEGVATFVGEKAAEAFFRSRGRLGPEQAESMQRKREAKRLFEETMFDLADRLRLLYGTEAPEAEKLEGRHRLFEEAKASLRSGLQGIGSNRYGGILAEEWNNAFLVSCLTYHHDPGLWEALYLRFDRDLRALVDWVKGLEREREPMRRIEQWLEEGEETG
jgi:predicted aminopeptidase